MSVVHVDQSWESDNTPFVFSGTMARSTTNAIEGTDARGGDGTAKDGYMFYAPLATIPGSKPFHTPPDKFVVDYFLRFKIVTAPSGGDIELFGPNASGAGLGLLRIRTTGGLAQLRSTIGTNSVTGATTLGTTAHELRMRQTWDFAHAGSTPYALHSQVWLDGLTTTEIDHRVPGRADNVEFSTLQIGVNASAKVTWECIFGRMQLITGVDPE